MNRLAQILSPEHVVLGLDVTNKKRAFEQIGLLFESNPGLSRAGVTQSLFDREKLGSTGIGQGVAIPHGCMKSLKNPIAAVVRLATPIAFDAADDLPVSLLIVLLVPENSAQRHLETLSLVAQMLSEKDMRDKLAHTNDANALHQLIVGWQAVAA